MRRAMGVKVLFLRSNPVDPDPRVEKEASALAEAGYEVRVVGWDRLGSLPERERREFGLVERLRIKGDFGKGFGNLPSLLKFQVALLLYLVRKRSAYEILHACDFDTVLPAVLVGRIFRKSIVYDVFDFYADMIRQAPKWFRRLIRFIDQNLMGWVDAVILADESRIEQIKGAKPKRLVVIYNSPNVYRGCSQTSAPPPLKIVYVGILQTDRGILEVFDVLEKHPEWELDLGGFGGDEELIRKRAEGMPNVRFHGRIPYEKVLDLTCRSHVLFATYDPSIPNHRFSSPNKLFEAMAMGKPIIVARGTGMDRLVEALGMGYVVEYGNLRELEAALRDVVSWTEEQRRAFAERVRAVFQERFSWGKMKERLWALYAELS
ncbi:glycosyltransferase family 4 protein [Thermus sp. LT1-2-5]|uniref:glycosyltransferase family 4 protein n=1 Tax=Thermus sp. LT1-2-5 TaxID=3026935 RepID=UPI0033659A55